MPPRKPPRRIPLRLSWDIKEIFAARVERKGGGVLVVMVAESPDGWGAVAVEGSDVSSTQALLDDHAHSIIVEKTTRPAAMRRAETYAQKWKRSSAKKERCSCKEIDVRPRARKAA